MDRQHEHLQGAARALQRGLVCSNREARRLRRETVGEGAHTSILDQPLKASRALITHEEQVMLRNEKCIVLLTQLLVLTGPGGVEGREGNMTAKV